MPSLPGISIRTMTPADIPEGLSLCRAAHWNQTDRDWEFFLSSAPGGALVAEGQGRVIGTVATLPYGPFTWISMVLVDPASRGRGVGRLLLERGLGLLPAGVTARLDATPAGEPLYRSLGFTAEHGLARWSVDAAAARARHRLRPDFALRAPSRSRRSAPREGGQGFGESAVASAKAEGPAYSRPMEARDWRLILQMDRLLFGASRQALLERIAEEAKEYAWVLEENERIRAYLFGRHGHVREQLGPLIADTRESAQVLLQACLAAHPGRSFFLDAPDRDDGWSDVLGALGFAAERPFVRMYRGTLTAPGNPGVVYAVTGPEFG